MAGALSFRAFLLIISMTMRVVVFAGGFAGDVAGDVEGSRVSIAGMTEKNTDFGCNC